MGLIASGALNWPYLGSGAIQSGHVASGQIGQNHLGSGAVAGALANVGGAIASRSLTNQTASTSGLLLTTSGPGLFRVTGYAVVTQGGLLNVGSLLTQFDWTDESEGQSVQPITGVALVTSGSFGQGSSIIRAASGTSIFHTVTLGSLVGTPRYNAYAAVERIF